MQAKSILGLVLTLTIVGLLIGLVLPVGLNSMNEYNETEIAMGESSTYEVTNELNATLDDANTTNTYVNLTLTLDNGDTYTIEKLDVGDTETVDTSAGELKVTAVSVDSEIEATVNFEYKDSFGWDSAERNIYGTFTIFILLVVLVVLAGIALKAVNFNI